jgi:hypothetical protein
MGRSGTSALTRVLSLCGAALPTGMMGADRTNPAGYWEPRESLLLNRGILDRHGSAWWDPSLRLLEEDVFDAEERAACITKIRAYLEKLPAAPLVVIKDLHIVALQNMWYEAARSAGYDVAAVITMRHPAQVIASLGAAIKASPELTSALWLKGNLLAERHTREVPRVFIDYADLLVDWHREIKRISTALEIDLTPPNAQAINSFITPDLHRQRHCTPVTDRFGTDWMSTVYEAIRAAAQDEPVDTSTLDRVYEEYCASERDFRKALEGSRSYTNSFLNKVVRPSIAKPVLDLVALAHRRRGTWA